MQLKLGDLLGATDVLIDDPLHLLGDLATAERGAAGAEGRSDRLQPGDFLPT